MSGDAARLLAVGMTRPQPLATGSRWLVVLGLIVVATLGANAGTAWTVDAPTTWKHVYDDHAVTSHSHGGGDRGVRQTAGLPSEVPILASENAYDATPHFAHANALGAAGFLAPQSASKWNPFRGRSAAEIDEMFRAKGYTPSGPDPVGGFGGYVNPKTGRSYHIDPPEYGRYDEPLHVDVRARCRITLT